MDDLSKILAALVEPLGIVWCLNLVGAVTLAVKRKWQGMIFCASIAVVLFLFGSTSLSFHLLASMERPYANQRVERIPPSDAVIMLGGTLSPSRHDLLGFEISDGGDRPITAFELIRQGKAPVLVLGGGGKLSQGWSEAGLLTNWSRAWNLPTGKVLTIPICANTREEVLQVQELFKRHQWQRVILVTSAYHMRRAEALFRQVGMLAAVVACDFGATSYIERSMPFNPVPRAEKFYALSLYLHEQIGWWVYRWRGWVGPVS